MKKRTSIFWSIVLIQLPVVLVVELIALVCAYAVLSKLNNTMCCTEIKKAADVAEYVVEQYDLDDPESAKECSETLSDLCMRLDAPYIYALEIDEAAGSEKYLALGFGKNATEEARQTRYNGYVVVGQLNQEMVDALHDDTFSHINHTNNRFGDTLICYVRLNNDRTNTWIVGVERSFSEIKNDLNAFFISVLLLTLALTVIFVLSFAFIVRRKVSIPAQVISEKMNSFVSEHREGYEKLDAQGSLEFSRLAAAFNSMTDEINQYIEDIDSLNREKHVREAELDIAKNIQAGLLPPAVYENRKVIIGASMLPAKEVGGDLYDYQTLDSGEIILAIADVSGKGVSAALFMARAITLLHMYANFGLSPAEMAEHFNNTLAENNPKKLFITAFIAKYDPKTGSLTYVNAGHNPPYLLSDELVMLDGAHGMAAGIFGGEVYTEETVTLKDGDALFIFTDGVNEAQNKNGELFTTEALEEALRQHTVDKRQNTLTDILDCITRFADGAVQSDDITMLLMTTIAPYHRALTLPAMVERLPEINDAIDAIPNLPLQTNLDLKLMAEEIFVNICYYAYADGDGAVDVIFDADDKVKMTFADSGMPYDPTQNLLNIEEYDNEHARGGLGKFITFQIADEYSYRYEDGRNILELTKKLTK